MLQINVPQKASLNNQRDYLMTQATNLLDDDPAVLWATWETLHRNNSIENIRKIIYKGLTIG